MRFTCLDEWLNWQESLHSQQIDLGLERVRAVLKRMANSLPAPIIILVGGTNGKGSSVAMLEAIYCSAGYRVGAYTSPHLFRYNERIRINGSVIDDESLCQAFERVDQARNEVSLTYFEFGTLAAIDLFAIAKLDVAIMEIGLGGRLDAVNVLDANVALLTAIDIDHAAWLGNDRESIGREKAGIFRQGRPAVCGDPAPPQSVIVAAQSLGASLYCLQRDFNYVADVTGWTWQGPAAHRTALPRPLLRGPFQLQNAAAVLMVVDLLHQQLPVGQSHIRQGLTSATVPGRFQVVHGSVTHIFDVAHNPHAARALAENLRQYPSGGQTHAVFSMLRDKDIRGVIAELHDVIDVWHVGGLDIDRGCSGSEIAQSLAAAGLNAATVHDTVLGAYQAAMAVAGPADRLVVFGSFYIVAAILGRLEP